VRPSDSETTERAKLVFRAGGWMLHSLELTAREIGLTVASPGPDLLFGFQAGRVMVFLTRRRARNASYASLGVLECDLHIVARGDGRRRLFHDSGHYDRFTQGLVDEVDRSSWSVIADCPLSRCETAGDGS